MANKIQRFIRLLKKTRIRKAVSVSTALLLVGVLVFYFSGGPVLAAVTVDTSTNSGATANPSQRKTWYDGTRYWATFYNGTDIEFWYSADGTAWTQNTSATLTGLSNDFSIYGDNSNAFIVEATNPNVTARKASTYPGTGFGWGTPTTVFTTIAAGLSYPSISRDTNGKLLVLANDFNDGVLTYTVEARTSTNADDISAWETQEQLANNGGCCPNSLSGTVSIPLAGGDALAMWGDTSGGAIYSKKRAGSTWDVSPTLVDGAATTVPGLLQAVSNTTADEAYLTFLSSTNTVVFKRYIDTSGWQTAVTLDSNTSNNYPTISINTSNSNLYVFWIRANTIYYKKGVSPYAAADWDTNPTTLVSTGTNAYLTASYRDGGSKIHVIWTDGTTGPTWNVKFESIALAANSPPATPTLTLPAASQTGLSALPLFQLRTADADADYLKYYIEVYDATACGGSLVRTIDQTASQTGWQGQDAGPGGNTAYKGAAVITGSSMATHQYQSPPLIANHLYSWRAKAIDSGGSNSSFTGCQNFTTATSEVQIQGGVEIRGGTVIQ